MINGDSSGLANDDVGRKPRRGSAVEEHVGLR